MERRAQPIASATARIRDEMATIRHEVTADDVAQDFLDLALARCATGSFATVDGGNIAGAPR
jgi:hypothetical protein